MSSLNIVGSYIDHELVIAPDSNGNRILDPEDPIIQKYYIKLIRNNYTRDRAILAAGAGDFWFLSGLTSLFAMPKETLRLGATFLDQFINPGQLSSLNGFTLPQPQITPRTINPADPEDLKKLTHFVGADFKINIGCKADIPHYVYESKSEISQYVGSSDTITKEAKDSILEEKRLTKLKNDIANFPNQEFYPVNFPDKDIQFDWLGLNLQNLDLIVAIHGASMHNAEMQVYMMPYSTNCISKVHFKGTIEDLYDYDLFADLPAPIAARIQFGRSAGLGQAGKLYWNTFHIDQDIELQFCF